MTFKELEAHAAKIAEENEALKAEIAKLRAELASKASAPAVMADEVFVLVRGLHHDGKLHRAGEFLPFDPANPPKGSEGLVEGVHYRRERILVRAPAA